MSSGPEEKTPKKNARKDNTDILKDKAAGCLLAAAIADALGWAVEGLSAATISQRYGELREFSQIEEFYSSIKERKDLPITVKRRILTKAVIPGLYSDDTQQALLLAEVIKEKGIADIETLAQKIIDCIRKTASEDLPLGAFRGYGIGFKKVAERLLRGIPPHKAGINSAGNGAAMRIGPVGIAIPSPEQAAVEAIKISSLTHKDIRAMLAAAAVAAAVSLAMGLRSIKDPAGFMQSIIELLSKICKDLDKISKHIPEDIEKDPDKINEVLTALRLISDNVSNSYEHTASIIRDFAQGCTDEPVQAESSFCLCSVMISFWHFLRHSESVEETITSAVNRGGDADTIATITGYMVGALRGKKGIPEHLLFALKNRKQIELRAYSLVSDKKGNADWQDFSEMELTWTKQLLQFRKTAYTL